MVHDSASHVRFARILIIVIFLSLRAGDVAFWFFSFDRSNSLSAMPGLIVGSALTTTVLLIALWRRNSWARYVLMFLIWGVIAVFSIPGMMLLGGSTPGASRRALIILVPGLLAYLLANVILIKSRRLGRLAMSRGCGN